MHSILFFFVRSALASYAMSKLSLGLGSCISCLDFGSYIASYTCNIFTALGKLGKLVEQKLEVHVDLFTAHDSFVQRMHRSRELSHRFSASGSWPHNDNWLRLVNVVNRMAPTT